MASTTNAYPIIALDEGHRVGAAQFMNGTHNPINGFDGPVILDVGQKTRVTSENAILGIILIALGLVQVFFGFRLIRATLVVTGFVSWAFAVIILMVTLNWNITYLLLKPEYYYFWMWFLAGIVGAILSFRFWDLGVTFSGGFGGFAVAVVIIAATNHTMSGAGRYTLLAIFILIGAAIATFFERISIIIGTSFGGAFLFMYGVDEFAQVGYREMLVIFEIAGKSLVYHPNSRVYLMLGGCLLLACVGIAWEFWHHAKPLWVSREAVFRIYGRPFGKRPHALAGQRFSQHISQMDWYTYLVGCLCLRRKTAEEVLYEDYEEKEIEDSDFVVVGATASQSHHKLPLKLPPQPHPQLQLPQSPPMKEEEDSIVVIVEAEHGINSGSSANSSGSEKLSDSETIVPGESGISSIKPPSHVDPLVPESSPSPSPSPSVAPVEVVVEEISYQDDSGEGVVVPAETYTESIVQSSDGTAVSVLETKTSTMSSSSSESHACHSSSRNEQYQYHHQSSSRIATTATTTTITTTIGTNSSSSNSTAAAAAVEMVSSQSISSSQTALEQQQQQQQQQQQHDLNSSLNVSSTSRTETVPHSALPSLNRSSIAVTSESHHVSSTSTFTSSSSSSTTVTRTTATEGGQI
ncbi:hypothetical protein BX616_005651 [Lobosporangium transversale]|nr:hypothetical protein BX616_005651 [Lobosporangium transversale]